MDESTWLASDDPVAMLAHVQDKLSSRRLHLFACACVRLTQLTELERAVSATETRADGGEADGVGWGQATSAGESARMTVQQHLLSKMQPHCAAVLRDIAGNPFRPSIIAHDLYKTGDGDTPRSIKDSNGEVVLSLCRICHKGESELLEGSCTRPWLTPTVVSLATAACEERLDRGTLDPVRLAILADALEEAGADCELLLHLRSPGPHVRGCAALDLILGKE